MMRPLKSLITMEQAKEIAMKNITKIQRIEQVSLENSLNRVLAEDIKANFDVPNFDRSAMDGYSVIAEDTFDSPSELKMIEIVHAGQTPKKELKKGECTQIATGGMLPKNANAVVKYEDTEINKNKVKIFKAVAPNTNVSKKGEDIKKGEIVLRKGEFITPSKIGVLASLGIEKVKVYEMPKVAVIGTGNEIAELREELKDGEVYNSNTYAICSIVSENGGIPIRFRIVEDEKDKIEKAIKEGLKNDLVVLSGGSSVGERDVLVDVLLKIGKILFHGVQIKPGKPVLFAIVNDKIVLGLPGYPTACLINGYVFLIPILREIARLPKKVDKIVKAKLSKRVVSTLGRRQFLTVKIENEFAIPVFKESGALTSMSRADGYIEIPENVDLVEKGEEVEVKLFY